MMGDSMQALLRFSRGVDWLSAQIGKYVVWLILASTVISALNAVVRKALNTSSNAFLEVQWYLFAASFLIAAGYTLLNGEHVKIDVVTSRLSKRARSVSTFLVLSASSRPCAWRCCGTAFLLPARLCVGRDVEQCRRPDPLAGVPGNAIGFWLVAATGLV
jgi:type IV secretory pathway VirB3-like protein